MRLPGFMNRFLFALGVLWCCLLPALTQTPAYQFLDDEAEPHTNLSFTLKRPSGATLQGRLTVVFDYRNNSNFYALDLAPSTAQLRAVIGGKSRTLSSTPLTLNSSSQV